jgi:predicted RNA-binding protein with PUA-like domain
MVLKNKKKLKSKITSEASIGFWLIKSKRDCYSIDQFALDKKTLWTGVRNYQARNFMMTGMKAGDRFLFYHSNIKHPGIFGVGNIVQTNLADPTALNKKDILFDPKASVDHPIWFCAEVAYEGHLKHPLTLEEIKSIKELEGMAIFRKAKRLSISPVSKNEFYYILKLSDGLISKTGMSS